MITPEQFNRDFSSCFRQRVPVVFFQLIPLSFLNGQALSLSVVVLSFLFIGFSFDRVDNALQLRLHLGWGLGCGGVAGMARRSKWGTKVVLVDAQTVAHSLHDAF